MTNSNRVEAFSDLAFTPARFKSIPAAAATRSIFLSLVAAAAFLFRVVAESVFAPNYGRWGFANCRSA